MRLMVREGFLSVIGFEEMEWKCDYDRCVYGDKINRDTCAFRGKIMSRKWKRTWDELREKKRKIGVIKGYVEVNHVGENETLKYPGEVWTERQRNERNSVNIMG